MTRHIELTFVKTATVLVVLGTFSTLLSCADQYRLNSARKAAPESRALQDRSASMVNEAATSRAKARFAYFETPPAEVARRIIYEAEINLVVKSMSETETQIIKLLKQADGYIADSNVDRRQGQHLTGRWKVRVPAAKFDSFLDEITKIGIAENRTQTAQDVTEEYVDLEAQITNKKRLEERIVALLKDANGKIKDVIEVEHELARVRGEIEQMEGRLRYLTNRTDLTTVSIVAREEENYVPPAAPTFTNQITQAWSSSVASLREFGEQLLVAAVYAFPWIVALSILLGPAAWYVKKRMAATSKLASVAQPQSTESSA